MCIYLWSIGHMYLYPSGGGQIGPTISIDRSKGCIDQGKFSHWCLCYVQFLWIHFAGISYISDHTLMYTRPIKLLLDSSQHFIRPLCLASNVSCATDTTFSRISLGTTSWNFVTLFTGIFLIQYAFLHDKLWFPIWRWSTCQVQIFL